MDTSCQGINGMDLSSITTAQFKARFYRDFFFANQNPDPDQPPPPEGIEIIQDQDIAIAFGDAQPLLNQALFGSNDNTVTSAYLLLTAHCLCLNIAASNGGMNSNGTGGFAVSGRSVDSTSENYTVPEQYADSALLAQYTGTAYGQRYLSLALPYLVGNMAAVTGGALAAW